MAVLDERRPALPGRPLRGRPPAPPSRPAHLRTPRRRRHRTSHRLARFLLVVLLVLLAGATTFLAGLLTAPFDETRVPPPPKAVLLLASDGSQIGSIRPTKRRELVPPEEIPQVMRDAIIAAEDERFLEHNGVDPVGITRAFIRDVTGGNLQGGSTLTQQYVKNVYVGSERSLERKIREAAIAVRLEQRKSKEEILADYLNVLYLGNSTYGVQAASRYYFGVDVKDLDLDEPLGVRDPDLALARAALLAGMAPAPSAWNPVRDPAASKVRQRYVLNQMVIDGVITPAQAGRAFERVVTIVQETPPPADTVAPEFVDLVEAQIKAKYTTEEEEDLLYRGGLRVQTTLDPMLQEAVASAARDVLPNPNDPQAAVVAIDYRTGYVKAMTTLRRYPRKTNPDGSVREPVNGYERAGFNLATNAYRSTGSTIKPFTLATALAQGHSLSERRSAPACDSLPNPGGEPNPYVYCNAGEASYGGRLTLAEALKKSVNTVYVPLALEVGQENVKNTLEAAGVRASSAFPIKTGNLSFGLGAGVEVSPISLVNAFGTLVNGGYRVAPTFHIATRNEAGVVIEPAEDPTGEQAIPRDVANQVKQAMSEVTEPGGTAPRARQPFPVYGKTGTTNDSVDAWFIGCVEDPYYVCLGVWMGYEDQTCDGVQGRACGGMKNVHGVRQVYGGTLPAEIFARSFDNLRAIEARVRAAQDAATAEQAAVEEPVETETNSPRPQRTRTRSPAPTVQSEPEPAPEPEVTTSPPAPEPTRTSPPPPQPSPTPTDDDDGGLLPGPG